MNKIRLIGNIIHVDLIKVVRCGSSINQFVEEPNTEVYYGNHAQVSMFDIGLSVDMDPYEGDWKNGAWAREQAFNAMKEALTPEMLLEMFRLHIESAQKFGRNEMRKRLTDLLAHEY